ncbi:unnamed protein product [Meganyctiphanes norvegica]|uniref:Uncharacterized protein n=1 Tax=Meganyctiphanes norvegica TaxID=48144 RepID=A0AAV2Q3E0_MEGNR
MTFLLSWVVVLAMLTQQSWCSPLVKPVEGLEQTLAEGHDVPQATKLQLLPTTDNDPPHNGEVQVQANPRNASAIQYHPDICLTKPCVTAAAEIIERLDDSVDPCEDFNKFVCGRYLQKKIIPDDKTGVSQMSKIRDELRQNLRILVSAPLSSNDSKATTMVKNLFNSCMDTDSIEAKGLTPLVDVLQELGGWPVVEGDAWNASDFNWMSTIFQMKKMGFPTNILVDIGVYKDLKNSSWRALYLDQPRLGMPSRKYLLKGLNDSDVNEYYKYQVGLAVLLGAERETAEKELKDNIEFEIEIAKLVLPKEERRNYTKLYNKISIFDLEKLGPGIPWLKYFNHMLSPNFIVNDDEPLILYAKKFISKITKLIESTPKKTVANYLMWHVAKSSAPSLNEEVRELKLKYEKQIRGIKKQKERWDECIQILTSRHTDLAYAVGSTYVKALFKEDAKNAADEMARYIHTAFNEILKNIDWMDDVTKERAINKAQQITTKIAYPPELLDDKKLNEFYDGLTINSGEFLMQRRNLSKFTADYKIKQLREWVDKNDWKTYGKAAVVNAFYSADTNSIVFPAGILQGVFFNADRPKYMNYGGIGYVIGHEITHGFDDKGRQFDANGNLRDWWEKETEEKFLEKANCMIWQYGNYSVPELGMKLNGKLTQGENIADNGGAKEAYLAYKTWVQDHDEEKALPGLPYTPYQLFWINLASVWCGKKTEKSLKLGILTDSHAPYRFRINGPLSNNEDFARDWNCPLESGMNPKHKCKVW